MNNPWIDYFELKERSKGRKIVCWGKWEWFEKTIKNHDFDIDFLVDSDQSQQGEGVYLGYDVEDPDILTFKEGYYIIITSGAFYEIIKQLEAWGYIPGEDFCVSPELRGLKVVDDMLQHEAKVLFSSSDINGGIYELSMPSGKIEKKVDGITRGFDKYKDNYFTTDTDKGLRVFDKDFKEIATAPLPEGSVSHGLTIDNGVIYIVLTKQDKVVRYHADTLKQLDEDHVVMAGLLFSPYWGNKGLYYHYNDLCIKDKKMFVTMFSYSGNAKLDIFDGGVMQCDLDGDDRQLIVNNLWQPHSPKYLNGKLCYLDSMRGDLYAGPEHKITHFNGFVRGLDFDGRYYYVGQSIHRYFLRLKGLSDNISLDAGIFLYDTVSQTSRFFPAPVKDINTVKWIGENNIYPVSMMKLAQPMQDKENKEKNESL